MSLRLFHVLTLLLSLLLLSGCQARMGMGVDELGAKLGQLIDQLETAVSTWTLSWWLVVAILLLLAISQWQRDRSQARRDRILERLVTNHLRALDRQITLIAQAMGLRLRNGGTESKSEDKDRKRRKNRSKSSGDTDS